MRPLPSPWRRRWVPFLLALVLTGLLPACRKAAPPAPAEVTAIPTLLREVFKGSPQPILDTVEEVVGCVENQAWPKASVEAQALSGNPKITSKQRETLARCLITINAQLEQAATAGNDQAQEVRRIIRQDK